MAKTSSVLAIEAADDNSKSKVKLKPSHKIAKLIQEKENLISLVLEHLGKTTKKTKKQGEVGIENIQRSLVNIKAELEKTDKQSMLWFEYANLGELTYSQGLLIELGNHLIDSCDEIDEQLKELYLRNMSNLLDRGELHLSLLTFNESTKQFIKEKGIEVALKKCDQKAKIRIALSYQRLLYECLNASIMILNQKGLQKFERDFIEYTFAYCFFRIPEFQQIILECLSVAPTEGTQNKIMRVMSSDDILKRFKNDSAEPKTSNEVTVQFDWASEFHDWIKDHPEYIENKKFLLEVLGKDHWRKRFTKRASGFFYFIQQLCAYVQKALVVLNGAPFEDIPGYQVIANTFKQELENRDLMTYPDSLLEASVSLLQNPNHLGSFCKIIINKRFKDFNSIMQAFEILDMVCAYLLVTQ